MIFVRNISVIQLKKFFRNGFQLCVAHVLETKKNETPRLEDFHVLQEFRDVFPDEFQSFLQRETLISQVKLF